MRRLRRLALVALFFVGTGCPVPLSTPVVIDVRSDDHRERNNDVSYGYIVFTHVPRQDDDFLCLLLTSGDLHPRESDEPAAATYWPAREFVAPTGANCSRLLKQYDFKFAETITDSLPTAKSWQVYLYAQAPGPVGTRPQSRICVDLTKMRNSEQLLAGIREWSVLMKGGRDAWKPQGFAGFVFRTLTVFRAHGHVHVDCE